MDFQYNFRQSYRDRLEDAGIVQYRPRDGFDVLKPVHKNQVVLVYRLRLVLNTIIALFLR